MRMLHIYFSRPSLAANIRTLHCLKSLDPCRRYFLRPFFLRLDGLACSTDLHRDFFNPVPYLPTSPVLILNNTQGATSAASLLIDVTLTLPSIAPVSWA